MVGSALLYPAGSTAPAPDGNILRFNEPEIGLLSVPPDLRGQGSTRALVAECARSYGGAGGATPATPDLATFAIWSLILALGARGRWKFRADGGSSQVNRC